MAPGEAAVASPQSMVALYSPGFGTPPVTSDPPRSMKVATVVPMKAVPSVADTATGVAVTGWSAMTAVLLVVVGVAPSWLMCTWIEKLPSSAYRWVALTVKVCEAASNVMTPAATAKPPPVPQSMSAEYSLVASAPPGSVKVATGWDADVMASTALKLNAVVLRTTDGSLMMMVCAGVVTGPSRSCLRVTLTV